MNACEALYSNQALTFQISYEFEESVMLGLLQIRVL